MLIYSPLWLCDPEDGEYISQHRHSRRIGRFEGKVIFLWQQSRLKSSLALLTTFYTIYMTPQIFRVVEETMCFIALLEAASVTCRLVSMRYLPAT